MRFSHRTTCRIVDGWSKVNRCWHRITNVRTRRLRSMKKQKMTRTKNNKHRKTGNVIQFNATRCKWVIFFRLCFCVIFHAGNLATNSYIFFFYLIPSKLFFAKVRKLRATYISLSHTLSLTLSHALLDARQLVDAVLTRFAIHIFRLL